MDFYSEVEIYTRRKRLLLWRWNRNEIFTISREEVKDLIEKNGGKNVSSLSKKTNYLIAGHNMGPKKREKAISLGIPIISEIDLKNML